MYVENSLLNFSFHPGLVENIFIKIESGLKVCEFIVWSVSITLINVFYEYLLSKTKKSRQQPPGPETKDKARYWNKKLDKENNSNKKK